MVKLLYNSNNYVSQITMKKILLTLSISIFFLHQSNAQTINDLIDQVSIDSLEHRLSEFSGEIPTVINGNSVTILNRVSANDNNLAADYLLQKLNKLDNITVTDQIYSSGGRNIIAVQEGKTNPDNIYMVCAHYDAVANYCADDNASGTGAVLEIARILSTQCIDNTIVYALWDEEEIGLVGAEYYANEAETRGDNILGVLNMDMMAYDGDNDNVVDIDVRPIANSLQMKDDLLSALTTYGFNLTAKVVNPGTTASDHARFWNKGYSAVLVGESWENNDQTPHYHTSSDRLSTLDMPYYFEITKLVMAYIATKAGLTDTDNTVTINGQTLSANQAGATYQWFNCDTNMDIPGATNQNYTPISNGNYSVKITLNSCTETSFCKSVNTLSVDDFNAEDFMLYPNPFFSVLNIQIPAFDKAQVQILDINGKVIIEETLTEQSQRVNLTTLSKGFYLIELTIDGIKTSKKLIKE